MRKPIGLSVPMQITIETPEETEFFSAMEHSSVRKEAIRHPSKEARLMAEVTVLTELVRVLTDRVNELEKKQ
jgi:hypothetical protein